MKHRPALDMIEQFENSDTAERAYHAWLKTTDHNDISYPAWLHTTDATDHYQTWQHNIAEDHRQETLGKRT